MAQPAKLSSRQRKHRIHYSRLKSAAITASYRLMHCSPDNILVRKTANAAINGMRPRYVKAAAEHKQTAEADIVEDEMYNHNPNSQPVTEICLIQEPKREKDFKPPTGFEFVHMLSAVAIQNSKSENTKPLPILCGSGQKYYLCMKRSNNALDTPITDIQITFKSTIPLGYQPLNYLFDGTELPYFQRKENEQKNSESNQSKNKANSADNVNKSSDSMADSNSQNKNDPKSQNDPSKLQNSSDMNAEDSKNEEKTDLDFDSVPLIIFSRNGESNIIDIELRALGTKMKSTSISIDTSLDNNAANLNRGTSDNAIRGIYISYACDLSPYRFSPTDLHRHINLKYLTPLLISIHLRKADLAITSIDSLKYLLLSNFIRFRDHSLMISALERICGAVSHSVVTWNANYHEKLMEIEIIIFQKFIHHLPAQCLWSMLVSSLIPLKYEMPRKFLKKYVETAFSYIRILEFGESLDESGVVSNVMDEKKNDVHPLEAAKKFYNPPQSPGGFKAFESTPGYVNPPNKNENDSKNEMLFSGMKTFVNELVSKTVSKRTAENAMMKLFQTKQFNANARDYVSVCCDSLFITGREKPWQPLSCMIMFLCRCALGPFGKNASRLRERACRTCTKLLEKIIDQACSDEYIRRMPDTFKYLLRRTISRMICYNLCNQQEKYEDIFNTNLRMFEKICLKWHSFYQHEIGVILTQVVLPQIMERFTPPRRRTKLLSCISRILQQESNLIELIYSLDVFHGQRSIHAIVDCLIGILVETASILKHDTHPTFEIADQSAKSYTNNYNFHHLAIKCLTYLCSSYSAWFQQYVLRDHSSLYNSNKSNHPLKQKVIDSQFGWIELRWQKRMHFHQIELKAMEIACTPNDEKAIKKAVTLLQQHDYLTSDPSSIAAWMHRYRFDIPASNMGAYLGGGRPKQERPWEEHIRLWYFYYCDLNYYASLEVLFAYVLTKCGFRLASEAQKIERTLESVAVVYSQARPELFDHSDAAFIVFNALLMLNTSLHNPRIKDRDKIQKHVFLGMCLGVEGQNCSGSDYERAYNYIEKNPIEISFETEATQTKRSFDEWKHKHILAARRPIIALTADLMEKMKDKGLGGKLLIPTLSVSKSESSLSKPKKNNNQLSVDRTSFNKNAKKGSYDYSNGIASVNTSHQNQSGSLYAGPVAGPSTPNNFIDHPSFTFQDDDMIFGNDNGGDDEYKTMGYDYDKSMNDEDMNEVTVISNNTQSSSHKNEKNDDDDDDDDDVDINEEEKEIAKHMLDNFKAHSQASSAADEAEYAAFCSEILNKSFWFLRDIAHRKSELEKCEDNVGLGCLLIDNLWPRVLDAIKVVFDSNDDPYTTPLTLSMLPGFLQTSLTLGAFGHESCKIAFDAILKRYRTWWLTAIDRMDETTKQANTNMATDADLRSIEAKIWKQPQKYNDKLAGYISASQRIVQLRAIWLRLRDLQFQFPDVHFMLKGREFIGEQTILKMGGRDTTYRLFFFSDMLLYATGRSPKYKTHRVLLLIFCALEDLQGLKFRIHSPQKSITIALPNMEYKRICFKKINELIVKQRKRIRKMINTLSHPTKEMKRPKKEYLELAEQFKTSSAFLHQTLEFVEKRRSVLENNCKLCLVAFNSFKRREKTCPVCNGSVCPKCITRKANMHGTKKKKNVCDGCLDIVEGRLKL